MEGAKFGKWTVIKKVIGPRRGRHFECQCACGYVKIISAHVLINGKSQQCHLCQKAPVIAIGERFGKWQVVSQSEQKTSWGARRYECQCKCGNMRVISIGDLRSGKSTQCTGCHVRKKNTSHSLSKTSTYKVWAGIMQRCYNTNNQDYALYGGRGINVCESWKDFKNFIKDMGIRPKGLEIDRIDVDGNYEPGNCRWVTRKENVANRRISAKNRDKYILVNLSKLCSNCSSKTTCG